MKRILTILIVLFSLSAGAQTLPGYFTQVASPYDYQWLRARYMRLPLSATGLEAGAIRYNAADSSIYYYTGWSWIKAGGGGLSSVGYGLVLSGGVPRADTFALATRDRVGVMIDSAKTTVPVPTLQQVLTAGNTATLNLTTTATLTGAMVQSTDGQAYITNSSGFGTAGFRDADGIIQTQITGFIDSSSNGRGKINTSVFTFKPMTNRLPNGASTSGYANLYYRAGAFRVSVDGVETDLGGGGASSFSALSDVAVSSPTANQTLKWNGSDWVNTDAATYSFTDLTVGDYLQWNGTNWVNVPAPSGGSILRQSTAPTDGTNEYFNTLTNKLGIKNGAGTRWLYFSPSDSTDIATTLSTPGSFTATAASSSQINLTWSDVANESNYEIQRSTASDYTGATTINSPAAGSTSYNNTGLSASTTYYYRIRAVGDGTTYSNSAWATASATTSAGGGTPQAYQFSGTSQNITVANNSDFQFGPSSAFTIGFGVKVSTGGIVRLGVGDGTNRIWDVAFGENGGLKAEAFMRDAGGSAYRYKQASGYSADTWYYVVMTFDGSDITLYINGASAGSNSSSGTFTAMATGGTLTIGQFSPSYSSTGGVINDLFVANTALSSAQVATLWNSGSPNPAAQSWYAGNGLAFWKFESNLNDEKGTHNGTATTPQYVNE